MDSAQPGSFNPLYGARQAREMAVKFANFWTKSRKWDDGGHSEGSKRTNGSMVFNEVGQ